MRGLRDNRIFTYAGSSDGGDANLKEAATDTAGLRKAKRVEPLRAPVEPLANGGPGNRD